MRITAILLFLPVISALSFFAGCNNTRGESGNDGFVSCGEIEIPSDMKCIPGGPFLRGSMKDRPREDEEQARRDEHPVQRIVVSTFLMDTNEVTYSQYQKCVKARKCDPAGPNYRGYSRPEQPMVGLNWYEARQYCTWVKKRLPTEAEWEKAARGPDGDLFPWGNELASCERAIIQENGQKGCGSGTTVEVGSRPAYRYGLKDMAGNSWEWVSDWYAESYEACKEFCSGKDPRGPCNGKDHCPGHTKKIVRGGSWWWDGIYAEGSNRRAHNPTNRPYHHYGFRCAKGISKD